MLVLSHRGFHLDAPENTLEAFGRAVELGADGIETDVRLSRDGLPVLFHDRVAPDGREVASLTTAELSAAAGYPVPTLPQALARWDGILWNVEVKTPAALGVTLEVLEALPPGRRLLVSSFWHPLVEAFARRGYEGGLLLASRPVDDAAFFSLFPAEERIRTAVWDYEVLDPDLAALATGKGIRTWVYGVHTPAEHRRCVELGLDGVITDRVDWLRG